MNRVVDTREGRVQQFTITAQSAPTCLLPTKFAGDLGKNFSLLIAEAVSNKKYNSFKNRITSYKLYEYFCDNKNLSSSAASFFQGYTEDEFRMLSKDWLMIFPTEKSLGKHLSNSVSFNSPSHKYLLSLLGLNESNAKDWHVEIFQDHCFLNVHTFQAFSDGTLRLTYEVPLAITTTQNYTATPLAFDTYNIFNRDIVSVSIVVEYEVDNKGNYIKNGGKLITLFVHDLPYRWDEIVTLSNTSPNVKPWGGSQTTLNAYIQFLAQKKGVFGSFYNSKAAPPFRLLPLNIQNNLKAKTGLKNNITSTQVEAQYSASGQIPLHNQNGKVIKKSSSDIKSLSKDPIYQAYYTDRYQNLASYLIQKNQKFLNQIQ